MPWRLQMISIPDPPDQIMRCTLWDQLDAVMTRSNIPWYYIRYCNGSGRTYIEVEILKYIPYRGGVHCEDLGETWSRYKRIAMYFVDNIPSCNCPVVHNKSINFIWNHCMNLVIYRTLSTSFMIYEWNWIYMNSPSNGYYIICKGPNIHHEIAYYVCLKLWRVSTAFQCLITNQLI